MDGIGYYTTFGVPKKVKVVKYVPTTYSESALRAVKLTNIIRRTYSPRKPERSTNIKLKFRLVETALTGRVFCD